MKRKVQYYDDVSEGIWSYLIKGQNNPCGCGSNCFHHEYDGKDILCVCNACKSDIYIVNDEFKKEDLSRGIWK